MLLFFCVSVTIVNKYKRKTLPIGKEQLARAIAAVRNGLSVYQAAKQYKIVYETLRLCASRHGITRKDVKTPRKVNSQQLRAAIDAVNRGQSVASASKTFKISQSTLRASIDDVNYVKHSRVSIVLGFSVSCLLFALNREFYSVLLFYRFFLMNKKKC